VIRARLRRVIGDQPDDGFTLVEMLVYGILSVVVLGIVGSMIINNATVSRDIRASTSAAGSGQIVAASIDQGVRDAAWLSTPTTGAKQFFTAFTIKTGASVTWQCQAWYFDSTGAGAVYTKTSPTKITQPTTSLSGWRTLAKGVTANGTAAVFSLTAKTISLSMLVAAPPKSPVLIQTSATARQTTTASNPCL
jgi:Tfp pilus assembly protein PilW